MESQSATEMKADSASRRRQGRPFADRPKRSVRLVGWVMVNPMRGQTYVFPDLAAFGLVSADSVAKVPVNPPGQEIIESEWPVRESKFPSWVLV
jgi:hypothetical protein